jgi:hypothetical protein
MPGTGLFAVGVTTAIAMAATGSVWLAAVIFLATGAMMVYQVGKSLL